MKYIIYACSLILFLAQSESNSLPQRRQQNFASRYVGFHRVLQHHSVFSRDNVTSIFTNCRFRELCQLQNTIYLLFDMVSSLSLLQIMTISQCQQNSFFSRAHATTTGLVLPSVGQLVPIQLHLGFSRAHFTGPSTKNIM